MTVYVSMLQNIIWMLICAVICIIVFIETVKVLFKVNNKDTENINQENVSEHCEPYDVKLVGKNTYQTVLKLAGGRDIEIFLKSDKELKKTQVFPLLAKLEIEDDIKSGVYEVDSETFKIKESKLENTDNIINLERVRDINNENAISIKDTDIELNKSYSVHIN